MGELKKKYVLNEKNQPIAVQIDLETFQKIEQLLEDYSLGKLLQEEPESEEPLGLEEARSYYASLPKSGG